MLRTTNCRDVSPCCSFNWNKRSVPAVHSSVSGFQKAQRRERRKRCHSVAFTKGKSDLNESTETSSANRSKGAMHRLRLRLIIHHVAKRHIISHSRGAKEAVPQCGICLRQKRPERVKRNKQCEALQASSASIELAEGIFHICRRQIFHIRPQVGYFTLNRLRFNISLHMAISRSPCESFRTFSYSPLSTRQTVPQIPARMLP